MTFSSSNFFPWALKLIFFILACEESKYAPCPDSPMSIQWHWKQIMWMLQLLGHSLWQHQEEENVFRQFLSVLWYNLVQKQHLLWVTFWQIVLEVFEDMGNRGIHFTFTCEGQRQHVPHERMHQAGSLCPRSGEGEPCTIACAELENSSACVCIFIYICLWLTLV